MDLNVCETETDGMQNDGKLATLIDALLNNSITVRTRLCREIL